LESVLATILNMSSPFGLAVSICSFTWFDYPLAHPQTSSEPSRCSQMRQHSRSNITFAGRLTRLSRWLPTGPLIHCLASTQCKLIALDVERADRLEPEIKKLTAEAGATGVVVLESHEGKGHWRGMQLWETVVKNYKGDPRKVLQNDPKLVPEDNCLIIFTSGTTGLPSNVLFCCTPYSGAHHLKEGVLSTQRQFLTNTLNVSLRGLILLRVRR
jgi:acyl-CoA synthetase (AMP-forming)/AMP-acid ligase II